MGSGAVKFGALLAAKPCLGLIRAARTQLNDLTYFSRLVLRLPLRKYQLHPLRAQGKGGRNTPGVGNPA